MPGQLFTDGLHGGGRTPTMIVVPHGEFLMGAAAGERGATDAERPDAAIRFERGFAMSVTEVTVGQFRRFVDATGYRARSTRRGYSIAYDERSGNFVRRGHVDWNDDYLGRTARDDLPVVHVSANDAQRLRRSGSRTQTGHRYRLPSEAEFEYALRAGSADRYPWGNGGAADRRGQLHRRRGPLAHGPRLEQRLRRLRRRRLGTDTGRALPAWSIRSSRPRRQCQRVGRRLLARQLPPRAARPARLGQSGLPAARGARRLVGECAGADAVGLASGLDADTTNARIGFRVVRDL